MRGRREREIARRLAERGDVEPPADLLARLQAEIPAEVTVGRATGREGAHRPAARQLWRVAASLAAMAAMVGAGLFSLRVFESARQEKAPPPASQAAARPEPRPAPPAAGAPPAASPAIAPPVARRPLRRLQASDAAAPKTQVESAKKPKLEEGAPTGVPGGAPGAIRPDQEAAIEQPAAVPAPPPAEPQATSAGAPLQKTLSAAADANRMRAEGARNAPEREARAKSAPPARVEDFVDRFAGEGPEVEAAREEGDRGRLLLFRLPSAAGAQPVELTFDPAAVARSRRVSAGSVALYELELQPGAPATAPAATLRLPAHPPITVRVADLGRPWEQASPGLRRGALAAELAEVLAGTRPRSALPEILRRARSLAAELPGDGQAAELVRLVEGAGP
jgi:hypothetical protein